MSHTLAPSVATHVRHATPALDEAGRFDALQRRLAPMYRRALDDPGAPHTVVVVPSMTLDRDGLARRGVVGRFGVDFVSTRTRRGWAHHAIEINLRKGGTTHPFLTLRLLTGGAYDDATGVFHAPSGRPCYFVASDNLCHPAFRGLDPATLIDAVTRAGLRYDRDAAEGVTLHLLGAAGAVGKLGAVCVGATRARARAYFARLGAVLDETARRRAAR